ncbi:MAG TPA: glycosyltransferase, partial [Thermoanaerobaculia bacterium]|nr:glycosyltransferase [Thermoanaerobaculia bacterium]
IVLGTLRVICTVILALLARHREKKRLFDQTYRPLVSILIAAYNEQRVIGRTIRALLASDFQQLEIVVVDDGSKDETFEEVERLFGDDLRVRVFRQPNNGKASALNRAIDNASGEILVCLDADTIFAPDTISKLVRRFADPAVGAVAGNVKVGNRVNSLTRWQSIEYITSQNMDRMAFGYLNAITVVPGAVGAWRREAVVEAGGYLTDTMAEDMDLTWRIRRAGWRIESENDALAFTEAPDTMKALFKQRFRWAFGTLQCLWKHRDALGRYGYFGRLMMPALWLFQIAYQSISPLVDLQILWTVATTIFVWITGSMLAHDWQPVPQAIASLQQIMTMYLFFFAIEMIGALVAFSIEKESKKPLVSLLWQRVLYRQLMYGVVLKAIKTAFQGIRTGWGKLERKGTVTLAHVK